MKIESKFRMGTVSLAAFFAQEAAFYFGQNKQPLSHISPGMSCVTSVLFN